MRASVLVACWFASVHLAAAREPLEPFALPQPNLIRIEAYVGSQPPGVVAAARWWVRAAGRRYRLYVRRIVMLTGDLTEMDLLQEAKPRGTAYDLDGPRPLLRRLINARSEQLIGITGYVRLSSRHLVVSAIEPIPAPTPTPKGQGAQHSAAAIKPGAVVYPTARSMRP